MLASKYITVREVGTEKGYRRWRVEEPIQSVIDIMAGDILFREQIGDLMERGIKVRFKKPLKKR